MCEVNVDLTFQKSEVRRDSGGAHDIVYADVNRGRESRRPERKLAPRSSKKSGLTRTFVSDSLR